MADEQKPAPAGGRAFGGAGPNAKMIPLGEKMKMLAAQKGDAPAITFEGETLTYRAFHKRTNRIARALQAAGVKEGDLVTIGLPNGFGFLEATWGAWKIGATPQPVSSRLPKHEIEAIAELAETPVVVADAAMPTSRKRLDIADLEKLASDDSDFDYKIAPVLKAPTSGGSTGRPKLILSGSRGVSSADIPEQGGWRIRRDDVCVQAAPLYHNAPFQHAQSALTQGAHLVLLPRFDAEEVMRTIAAFKATWVYLVPTMMNRIWHLPPEVKAKYDMSTIRTLWHLAAPCPPWLKEAFINWLGPDVIMELYAGTEAQAATIITGREWLEHRGSVGRVTNGAMQAFDENGNPLPPGEMGEIFMRRPEGANASYQYRGATARTLPGGWESLGDMGYIDKGGYLYLGDRRTDMILVGGANIYPAEIEAALDEHPLVLSSAVIGLPDDDLGNRVHAIVHGKPGVNEADLRRYLEERLVRYKQPRSYEFVDTPVRDDAGKVRRTALRDERIARMKAAAGK
jgi:bile acid-coenzyme A ligase